MWPWGHLAAGYLLWTALVRERRFRPPTGAEAVLLAVGTQFPDLVDKPLAWSLGVLPNGRSLAHSMFVAAAVVAVAVALARRRDRPVLGVAFGVGYGVHLATDALPTLAAGRYADLAFLAWPLLPAVEYDTDPSFAAHFLGIEPTPLFLFEIGLSAVALAVWVRDGTPGVDALRATLGGLRTAITE
ncbi:metal-dependent hydrolase [Halostella litorea]|uniref:metal-dependent hydrolase n=1 Tax=Halostella litorea TaxID=2528831 RepID=UPI0010925EEE|nr:metal-dependent hydrolase [Halostella litorea]